jgi:Methyltransferase small domain
MTNSRQTGLLRLKHLRERSEAKAEEMTEQRERFDRLRTGGPPRVVVAFNLFQTPEAIAEEMVKLATAGRPLGRMLEPSAGLGRIYRAARTVDRAARMVLVDNNPDCCRELYVATEGDLFTQLIQGDFLTIEAERLGQFDSIVMNPPFKQGTDIKHIARAAELLAPGGRLVALCYNGTRQQAKLKPIADSWLVLPEGAFKSEGTGASVALLTIDR